MFGQRKAGYTFRMAAVSSISAMKVDTPRVWQSPAPTRAKMQSRTAMRAESHGTQHPTWASSTFTPTCAGACCMASFAAADEKAANCHGSNAETGVA
jgi:hypothetical protein